MKRVALSEAKPGDVVARPVMTASGVVLVQPGTTLTPELLVRLDTLHVDALCLQGASADAAPLDKQLEALDRRFAGHEQDPVMMELKAVVANRLSQGASDERAG
jgi:hypothetical protein